MMNLPLLTLLLLTLPAGAALIMLLPAAFARRVALGSLLLALGLALLAVVNFDSTQSGFQLVDQAAWMPSLGIQYLVGVDGISILFLPATALLFTGAVLASWNRVVKMPRGYFSLLLLEGAATLGIFCALDTIFFFLLWELSIIPLYFLVSLWGRGRNSRPAASKYAMIMIAGGLPLLFAFLLLANTAGAEVSGFDLRVLLAQPPAFAVQMTVFVLLLLGFGIKAPLVPAHTWLPLLALEGPAAITAVVAGVKIGVYGLLRYALPLAPEAAASLQWLLVGLGSVGMLYGVSVALAQTNLRSVLAYLGIAHVGLVLLGIATLRVAGVQGAVFELLNFTLVAGGLFLLTDFLWQRTGTTSLPSLGGVARTMPLLASAYLVLGLASLGAPGTVGFPAELLILLAALQSHIGNGLLALVGVVMSAACFLSVYRRVFFGAAERGVVQELHDLQTREKWVAATGVLIVLAIGLYPSALLDTLRVTVEAWVLGMQP